MLFARLITQEKHRELRLPTSSPSPGPCASKGPENSKRASGDLPRSLASESLWQRIDQRMFSTVRQGILARPRAVLLEVSAEVGLFSGTFWGFLDGEVAMSGRSSTH